MGHEGLRSTELIGKERKNRRAHFETSKGKRDNWDGLMRRALRNSNVKGHASQFKRGGENGGLSRKKDLNDSGPVGGGYADGGKGGEISRRNPRG